VAKIRSLSEYLVAGNNDLRYRPSVEGSKKRRKKSVLYLGSPTKIFQLSFIRLFSRTLEIVVGWPRTKLADLFWLVDCIVGDRFKPLE